MKTEGSRLLGTSLCAAVGFTLVSSVSSASVSVGSGPLSTTSYEHFEEDLDRYQDDFVPYLPSITTDDAASDYELFLPVSYHMNSKNYDEFTKSMSCSVTGKFDWYGTMPDYKYCGFYGRTCYSDDPWCKAHCASDVLQAFGDDGDSGGPDNDGLHISPYFTWYSKKYNQPILSGFWGSAYLAAEGVTRACDNHPTMCDPTCADSGPLYSRNATGATAGQSFAGCGSQRACGKFATCALGSAVIEQYWMDEQPDVSSQSDCEAKGYTWTPAYGDDPAHCSYNSMSTSCTTGRCFDRGHIVPSGAMGQLFGRSGESFTMCNIAAQTSILNECKWMYIEQVVACIGRYYRALTLAGSLGPWTPSERFKNVPKPQNQWKLLFLPKGQPGVTQDTVLTWVLSNDEEPEYDLKSYCGFDCLSQIEDGLGLRFPDRLRDAHFPSNSTAILTELLSPSQQSNCLINKAPDGHTLRPTHTELASWGPWNVIYADAAESLKPLPTFECPGPS